MSADVLPAQGTKPPPIVTMAQLQDAISADTTLTETRRRDMLSALRGLAKALGRPPESVPTAPAELRPLLARFPAAKAHLSTGRWRNIVSLTQGALAHVGLTVVPGRSTQKLPPAWDTLLADVPAYGDRYKLGRFARYCTAAGILPAAVDAAVLDGFLDDLRGRSLAAEPERLHRDVIIAWNRMRAANPSWPGHELPVPDNRDVYALPWHRFPPSLRADVEAWLDHLAGTDLLAEHDFRPLRPTSLRTRRRQIHLFISAIALRGHDPTGLRTLADIVVPERVADGLRFFWERAGNKPSLHAGQVAGVITSIARHWVKCDEKLVKRLVVMAGKITPRQQGMTRRNRDRLRPFYDRATLLAVLALPRTIRRDVTGTGHPTRSLALQFQTALAIELLTKAPMRLKNLAEIRIGTRLLRDPRGGATLILVEEDVKNEMPQEIPLSGDALALLDLYLKDYWPLLGGDRTPFLFPGSSGDTAKCADTLRQQISGCVRTRCGVEVNPHLFRHLCAFLILQEQPGAYGLVQKILGHKNIATTINYYAGMEGPAAFRHYDALITGLRDEAVTPIGRPIRKHGKTKPPPKGRSS